jgi:Kef-type K+ transport system membrane component KefB
LALNLTAAYVAVMFFVVRPLLLRFCPRFINDRRPSVGVLAAVLAGLLVSALTTGLIGIHAIFGAFLFGAIIPHESRLAHDLTHRLEKLISVLLLPAFFAFTGMQTEIGLISGWDEWLLCGAIILAATVGKFGGVTAAARWTGLNWRDAAGLGILMNTRGLMELIVLNVGLDLAIISPTLFAMMVLMALVTTLATTPILRLIAPDAFHHERAGSN